MSKIIEAMLETAKDPRLNPITIRKIKLGCNGRDIQCYSIDLSKMINFLSHL